MCESGPKVNSAPDPSFLIREEAEPTRDERYHDSGLPLETEVYGFLDALDVTWSTFEVEALTRFIQGRIDAREAIVKAMMPLPNSPTGTGEAG